VSDPAAEVDQKIRRLRPESLVRDKIAVHGFRELR
jgi:hypothetical protein